MRAAHPAPLVLFVSVFENRKCAKTTDVRKKKRRRRESCWSFTGPKGEIVSDFFVRAV